MGTPGHQWGEEKQQSGEDSKGKGVSGIPFLIPPFPSRLRELRDLLLCAYVKSLMMSLRWGASRGRAEPPIPTETEE